MIFDAHDYALLHILFTTNYPGYRPEVKESPNGDGVVDWDKRYLHVALKYNPPDFAVRLLARAHFEACRIAEALGVPKEAYPHVQDGTLRVLEYGPGAGSAPHTDFDLFTVSCYRDSSEPFVRLAEVDPRAEAIDPRLHLGELAELFGVGKATPHLVTGMPSAQHSIVYLAMPSLSACLPDGRLVSGWLAERKGRSRYGTK